MDTFESVYSKHRDAVLRFAIRCIGRRDLAEELTAEAFLELHRHWKQIETDRLPSWLFTVVKNRASNQLRRLGLERDYLASAPVTSHAPAAATEAGLFNHPALKPVHRICLILRYVHEMSLEEIAGRLNLSPVQVKGHLQYSKTLLRKELTAETDR